VAEKGKLANLLGIPINLMGKGYTVEIVSAYLIGNTEIHLSGESNIKRVWINGRRKIKMQYEHTIKHTT
jgi:hypothetical protein